MRWLKGWILAGSLLVSTGCEYGPEHIPSFRAQRDAHLQRAEFFQELMVSIAQKHGLPPEPGPQVRRGFDAENQALATQLRACADENSQLAGQLRELQDEWFANMSKEQQIQWLMHKDKLAAERERIAGETESAKANRQLQRQMHDDQIRQQERERWRKLWVGDSQNVKVEQDVTVRRLPY